MSKEVFFRCVKDDKHNLKVKIISKGYNNNIYCTIPYNLRKEGRIYKAPSFSINFQKGLPFFPSYYKVKTNYITILTDFPKKTIKPSKIYTEEKKECVVCLENNPTITLIPCGHKILCSLCLCKIEKYNNLCPICREKFTETINENKKIFI